MKTYLQNLILCTASLLILNTAFADTSYYHTVNPSNTHPIGGRIFIQSFDSNDSYIQEGTLVDLSLSSTSNYSPYFFANGDTYTYQPVSNSYDLKLKVSKGFKISGFDVEAGGIIRTYQDQEKTELSVFLLNFHELVGATGHIPESWQTYSGEVGENQTLVIGKDGQFFITTADLYFKLQTFKGTKDLSGTFKLVVRLPISDQEFNTQGVALIHSLQRRLSNKLLGIVTVSANYQDLSPHNFNSQDLKIRKLTAELFAAVVYDPGSKDHWYVPIGLRYSPWRVRYKSNSRSASDGYSLSMGVHYKSPRGWEAYLDAREEVIQIVSPLEPDFSIEFGFRKKLGH